MSANILYHSARPLNDNSNGFGEFDSVDFEILDVGRKLLKNSVYVEADLVVHSTGTTEVLAATNIGVNNNTHSSNLSRWTQKVRTFKIYNPTQDTVMW